MNQKGGISCDFVCEWFDFLRAWITNDHDNHDEDRITDIKCSSISESNNCAGCEDTENGHQLHSTDVTCFNCDANFLFFGTNTGWIYCFSRGERQAKGPLYEHHPVKSRIIGIEIPDENVVLLLLPHGFALFNFVQNELLYSWSQKRLDCQADYPSMVTSKCIYDESRHRYNVFTGDSIGTVRCHNVIGDETVIIFKEENNQINGDQNNSSSTHHHKIVQIDVYSSDLALVSSCFRTVILWKSISDSWSAIQVGLNVRKVCGHYGAVFHKEGNIIFASRPAMHLIKANTTDGTVIETFKLKSAKPLRNLNLFKGTTKYEGNDKTTESKQQSSPSTSNSLNTFNLGFLMPIQLNNEVFICSWNSHSLFIIKLDGTLIVKEYSPVKIIATNVSYCKGFRDIIILREDWTLFRIRFIVKDFKPVTSDYGISDVLKETIGSHNFLNLPSQALNSLEGEIKKIYSIMQDKIYESGEKLLTYTSFDNLNVLRRNSSVENHLNQENTELNCNTDFSDSCSFNRTDSHDCDNNENFDISSSPLYIHQKVSRKSSVNSKISIDSDKSEENVLFEINGSDLLDPKHTALSNTSLFDIQSTEDSQNIKCNENKEDDLDAIIQHNETLSSVDKIEAQNKSQSGESTKNLVVLEGLELVKKFHQQSSSSYAADVKLNMVRSGDNIFNNSIEFSNESDGPLELVDSVPSFNENVLHLSSSSKSKSYCSSIDETVQYFDHLEEESPIIPIAIQEPRSLKHVDWHLAVENTHNSGHLRIKCFCASGYSDTESKSFVWLSCFSKNRPKLVYYPDFESLRLPPGNNKSFIVGAVKNKIYLLNQDNELWFREGVDEISLGIVPLGTLATKWTKMVSMKTNGIHLTSLSLCSSDSIGWFCDSNGDVWLAKLQTGSWVKISHDPDNRFHVKEVQVCPTDSSLVWCTDKLNKLFVRAGIFNTRGDADEHISGMAWLLVHAPVEVKSLAVTKDSVWILSKQDNRIFKRIGIQPPSSYVGTDWQEIKSPTLLKDSLKAISASLNGDIWLLTEQGSIWQVCDP